MIDKAPIVFTPYLKSVIWGGNKICAYKDMPQCGDKIGESWEISAVPGHESVVADGKYEGKKITDLIDMFGAELLGTRVYEKYDGKFPLLIKIIDANDNLSVQVHPDDELAMKRHNSLGKTEMWYIIDAEKNAKIFSGLKQKITPEEYVKHVADNTFADLLAVHSSAPGDVFFLPAGRIHAIGAGNLLAEIQESSDITYRIYDYDRRDANGNPRELHTQLAKDAIDYNVYSDYKSAPADASQADAVVAECSHFKVRRLILDGEIPIEFTPDSFTVVMCLEGSAELICPDGKLTVSKGHTVLCPAAVESVRAEGRATLLIAQA